MAFSLTTFPLLCRAARVGALLLLRPARS